MIRVAITSDRYRTAAVPFITFGLDPIPVPCIRVEPAADDVLARARGAVADAGLLLVTSARTVELLWPRAPMPPIEVAAVGRRTAAAIEARGGRVVLSGRFGLADLIDRAAHLLASSLVVFPHAANTDPTALDLLKGRAQGRVQEFEVYRTVPVAAGLTAVRAVAFASPSSVEGWLMSRDLEGVVVGAIGPTTRSFVAGHRPPDVIAPQPSHFALARAMASYFEVSV